MKLQLGALPPEKLPLLAALEAETIGPPHAWRAKLIYGNAAHVPREGRIWQSGQGIDSHRGTPRTRYDLVPVGLEIGAKDARAVRDARFTYSKLFERVIVAPCPPLVRTSPPRKRRRIARR